MVPPSGFLYIFIDGFPAEQKGYGIVRSSCNDGV